MSGDSGDGTLGHVTIVYPAKLNRTQVHELDRMREVICGEYNHFLGRCMTDAAEGRMVRSVFEMHKEITERRRDDPVLRSVNVFSLRDAPRRARQAVMTCLARSRRDGKSHEPRVKTVARYRSFPVNPESVRFEGNRIRLTKDLSIRCRNMHIPKGGKVVSARVVYKGTGRYYIHVTFEKHLLVRGQTSLEGIEGEGYDLGLLDEVTDSRGNKVRAPDFYAQCEDELSRLRSKLSKLDPESARAQKLNRRIARLEERVARRRDGYLDKVANGIVEGKDVVVMEDIDVRRMVCLKDSTVLRRKRQTEAAWGILVRKVERKARKSDVRLIKVNPAYTTRTCSQCGHVGGEMPLTTRQYSCPECGLRMDRDRNAALNILGSGMGTLRHAEPSG